MSDSAGMIQEAKEEDLQSPNRDLSTFMHLVKTYAAPPEM